MGPFLRATIALAFLLAAAPAAAQVPNPLDPGPDAVTVETYDYGDSAFRPEGFPIPVELRAVVYAPANLGTKRHPLIVLMHGRHSTCYSGTRASLAWPCPAGWQPIPSHLGYDDLGRALASHGYIVASVSANGINARDNATRDLGMYARGQLIQMHLAIWSVLDTAGGPPFGTRFKGKVDLTRVGTMGHSRGGEGVVWHALINDLMGKPYGLRAVFSLAPVNFSRQVVTGTPHAVLLPYCDGDVRDLQGVHYFDDARYRKAGDAAPRYTVLVMGANHNYFNLAWTPGIFPADTRDDWTFVRGGGADPHCGPGVPGNGRLEAGIQRVLGAAFMAAFFRAHVGGERAFLPVLSGRTALPGLEGTSAAHVTYHPGDLPAKRLLVNRWDAGGDLTRDALGGAASQSGVTPYDLCGGPAPQPQYCLPGLNTATQPHTVPSARAPGVRGLPQLRAGWSATGAFLRNVIPAGKGDVRGFTAIQVRAAVNGADARTTGPLDFTVTLADAAGKRASVRAGAHSRALYVPPGAVLPHLLLNGVRVPLNAFTGVDLSRVTQVEIRFDRSTSGAFLLSDLLFSAEP